MLTMWFAMISPADGAFAGCDMNWPKYGTWMYGLSHGYLLMENSTTLEEGAGRASWHDRTGKVDGRGIYSANGRSENKELLLPRYSIRVEQHKT